MPTLNGPALRKPVLFTQPGIAAGAKHRIIVPNRGLHPAWRASYVQPTASSFLTPLLQVAAVPIGGSFQWSAETGLALPSIIDERRTLGIFDLEVHPVGAIALGPVERGTPRESLYMQTDFAVNALSSVGALFAFSDRLSEYRSAVGTQLILQCDFELSSPRQRHGYFRPETTLLFSIPWYTGSR